MSAAVENFYEYDELLAIYEKAGAADLEALRAAALALYPERASLVGELYLVAGRGRAFKIAENTYAKPLWTFGGPKLREIGILENGEAKKY